MPPIRHREEIKSHLALAELSKLHLCRRKPRDQISQPDWDWFSSQTFALSSLWVDPFSMYAIVIMSVRRDETKIVIINFAFLKQKGEIEVALRPEQLSRINYIQRHPYVML